MPFELITDINLASIPLLPTSGRSSLHTLKRMTFLRWSAAEFLSTVAKNRGLERPSIGFSDDDFFRGIAQALIGDVKTTAYTFSSVLEIILGPYETMYFELSEDHLDGATYLSYQPYGDYVPYTNVVGGPFTVGERIEAIHPVTRLRTIATVKEDDTVLDRIYFINEAVTAGAKPFDIGVSLRGLSSGAVADVAGHVVRRDHYAFPLYGQATIDPGGGGEEVVTFVAPDPYIGRVRLVTDLVNAHNSATKIKITGGCWDLIDTKARRVTVRITCAQKDVRSFPGNSYLHNNPYVEPRARLNIEAGDTSVLLNELVLEPVPGGVFPMKVIINPENDFAHANSQPLLMTASSYTVATRTLALTAGIPAGKRFIRGTKVRWYQSRKAELLDNAAINDTFIVARCRWENPQGVWRIADGAPELVFVKGTSYQKRRLVSQISPATTEIYTDLPFEQPDTTFTPVLVVTDTAGTLGTLSVLAVDGTKVTLSAPAGFASAIQTRETTLEMVKDAAFRVHLYLHNPIAANHVAPLAMSEFLGTTSLDPTYADHLVSGGWQPAIVGTWPGPYIYDPEHRSPINEQTTGAVEASVDITSTVDPRIYLANETLSVTYNPRTATPSPMGDQIIPLLGTHKTTILVVSNADVFPTQAAIDAWRFTTPENTTKEPPRIVVGQEGVFNTQKVYLFGRGAAGTAQEGWLYVSGIQKIHQAGVRVATYTDKIPVFAVAGVFGGDPGFDLTASTVLFDYGTLHEEEVDYTTLTTRTPTRAFLNFPRGFTPQFSHNPLRVSDVDPAITLGVNMVRADRLSIPRVDGFSFPFYLNGGLTLRRLRVALDIARAAGIQLNFVSALDLPLPI